MICKTAPMPSRLARISRLFTGPRRVRIRLSLIHLLGTVLLVSYASSLEGLGNERAFGVAWRVIGSWRIAGNESLISGGNAVFPGSLLEPDGSTGDHSITVLLPDGQRILYECFTPKDCERGFRVPSLYREPVSIALDLMTRVNATSEHARDVHNKALRQEDSSASKDEAVGVISGANSVEVGGLAAALSDGTYSYVMIPLSPPGGKEIRGTFDKRGRSVALTVSAEGLFEVLIYDRMHTPRIDLLLAALRQPRAGRTSKSFADVEAILKDWNEDYQGWPVHEFRRKYLESVMLGIEAAAPRGATLSSQAQGTPSADVTCEPQFDPRPGVLEADTEVTLHCSTAGARIHFTVDGAQPLDGAPVYGAPIVVKGTALTIKAFATAEGKKDSPVVTGIFRIGD